MGGRVMGGGVMNGGVISGGVMGGVHALVISHNQLTISPCSHGYAGDTATHSILPPHPHIVHSGGNEAIQSRGKDISCNHLCLKWGCRT